MKKIKFLIMIIFLCLICLGLNVKPKASNSRKTVLLGGDTIGLKLDTGIYVVGKYQVATNKHKLSPWKDANIDLGDKIVAYNHKKIKTNKELLMLLKEETNDKVTLDIERGSKIHSTQIDVVKTKNNDKSLGLYIKDKLIGIGTLTFIDEKSNAFASLGHGIYDDYVSLGNVDGIICNSCVNGIKKSTRGLAGEKKASLMPDDIGVVLQNKTSGVYGKITNQKLRKKVEVGTQKDVKIGPAKIYTVIKGNKIEEFDIKITKVNLQNNNNVKGLKYEVTDNTLLNATGGIIQGMSGSPIVQNDLLIGAVSHVIVDEPTTGYGVHIDWMIDDLEAIK